jgi:hypothetical protein
MNTTTQCKYCKEDILAEASICKHCGKKQPKKTSKRLLVGLGAIFVLLVAIGSSSSPSTPSTPRHPTLKVGETGVLTSGSGGVFVARNEEINDEMFKLITAKDTDGLTQMVLRGEVLLVDNGTPVRVIGSTTLFREVRISGGEYSGMSGWVPNEFVTNG